MRWINVIWWDFCFRCLSRKKSTDFSTKFVCLYFFIISNMLIISNKTNIVRFNIVNNTDESNWPQHKFECIYLIIISNKSYIDRLNIMDKDNTDWSKVPKHKVVCRNLFIISNNSNIAKIKIKNNKDEHIFMIFFGFRNLLKGSKPQ